MGFFDEAKAETEKGGQANSLPQIEQALGKKEYEEFIAAIKNPGITIAAIHRVLKARGIKVSENTVRKYRSENVFG